VYLHDGNLQRLTNLALNSLQIFVRPCPGIGGGGNRGRVGGNSEGWLLDSSISKDPVGIGWDL